MKTRTPEEIRQMFLDNVRNIEDKKQAEREKKHPSERCVKNKESDIYVTNICSYLCYCPRAVYYEKVVSRPVAEEALLRFGIGHAIHEVPVNADGNEVPFEYKGFRCRMDDINKEEGWIADKKTVSSFPRKAKQYVTLQLNMYKIIAEENEKDTFKVNQLFVVNINVNNGKVETQDVPIMEKDDIKNIMFNTRADILNHIRNRELPDAQRGGWWCDSCSYTDLCKVDAVEDKNAILKDIPVLQTTMETFINEVERTSDTVNLNVKNDGKE